jgi:hypothetical protein
MIGTLGNCRVPQIKLPPKINIPPKVRLPQINKPVFKPQLEKFNGPAMKSPGFKPNFNQVPK